MRPRLLNQIGITVLLVGAAVLVAGLILRTSGVGAFVLVAAWALLPYICMFGIHRYLGREATQAAVALVASALIAALGAWLTVDALFINFSPISTGIAVYIGVIYQLPLAACALAICGFIQRRSAGQPSNHTIERDARKSGARPSL